ncbi:MAG: hypothetical protein JXR84_08480 [Anaerolineae bacterium]|nr:hypothetical protein [Anaerolineae bacterium]
MQTRIPRRSGGKMPKTVGLGIALLLFLLMTACSDTTAPQTLPQAEAARLAVIMTATAEAEKAAAAAEAAAEQERIAAGYANATATVESYYMEVARINATATAEAFAREEAQRAIDATATAVAFYPTATAIAQAAVERDMELERQRLALEEERQRALRRARRDEMLLPFTTYGPWFVGIVLAGVIIYGLVRLIITLELRGRAIKRDERGDAPLMLLRNGRATIIYDSDRAFGPVARMDQDGITMPALVDDTYQAQVTMRDQAVDLATRHLPRDGEQRKMNSRQRAAAKLAMTGSAPPTVRVVDAQTVRNWLQDVRPQALALSMNEVGNE